tara:strand:+ start:307 stop:618 length:312 start_codon:yes stop_codon:yes gene_type:complete
VAQTEEQKKFTTHLDDFVEKQMTDLSSFEVNFLKTIEDADLAQNHLSWRAEHLKNDMEERKEKLSVDQTTDFQIKFENYRELIKLCKEKRKLLHQEEKIKSRS